MHIGILKVASALEAKGYKIDFLDFAAVENFNDALAAYISSNSDVKTFGVTATTPQIPYAFNISQYIKKKLPDSKVILGGTHPSLMYAARKNEKKNGLIGRATNHINVLLNNFDILVVGDGEKAIFEAFKISKGIIDADDPKSHLFLTNDELTVASFPARHLIDVHSVPRTAFKNRTSDGQNVIVKKVRISGGRKGRFQTPFFGHPSLGSLSVWYPREYLQQESRCDFRFDNHILHDSGFRKTRCVTSSNRKFGGCPVSIPI